MIRDNLNDDFYYHFLNGTLQNAYDYFGAHLKKEKDEIIGCEFLTYAPNATTVSIECEHNNFKEIFLKEIKEGFFYLYIEGNIENKSYKYIIYTKQKTKLYKADPYAFKGQLRPNNSSVVYDLKEFNFNKKEILCQKDKPIIIYEMHIASWLREKENSFLSYTDIIEKLIKHLKENNFTHVEFLPITEHPLDDSWGYMTTGYYAPTTRHGEAYQLQILINELQKNDISVILDLVPGHVCRDDFGIYKYDGSFMFEYDDEEKRENKEWGTANLDFQKFTTRNFLISNLLYWIKYFNVDGFRIDAVNNLIYYLGNKNIGVNHQAIMFLKELNKIVRRKKENILMIAEDSSAFPNVTNSYGIDFDYKWNMGWMNDSLKYFSLNSDERINNHNLLTFGFTYIYSEKFILAISHDEVVHLKKSLYNKMPGTKEEKFNNLRSFFGFMFTHPGKKLLFMGQEFAQDTEWNFKEQIKFELYNEEENKKLNLYFKDITKLYKEEYILYKTDSDSKSLKFIEANNNKQSIYIYAREYEGEHIIIVLNASKTTYNDYRIGVLSSGCYIELLNSDSSKYGGSNNINNELITEDIMMHDKQNSLRINLGAYSTTILKHKKNTT